MDSVGEAVDFLTIYIVEAHAQDEWPVGDPLHITQPISDPERCGVARQFAHDYKLRLPLLVDSIENSFSEQYAAWPIRFFVLQQNERQTDNYTILYKAQPDRNNTYDSVIPALGSFLQTIGDN
jgi:hypothetical protein